MSEKIILRTTAGVKMGELQPALPSEPKVQVLNSLTEILVETLDIDASRISDGLEMCAVEKWNSITHIELIVGLEEKYGIQFTQDDVVEMISVNAIKTVLSRHGVTAES